MDKGKGEKADGMRLLRAWGLNDDLINRKVYWNYFRILDNRIISRSVNMSKNAIRLRNTKMLQIYLAGQN